jgi:hypothetical protein
MSFFQERETIGPLSGGNVVSAAISIYRDRFKLYYSLAFQSGLWSLVPVYGWAKCLAVASIISRLVYCEIIGSPEELRDARRHVNPKMWELFAASLLVSLIFVGVTIPILIAIFIFSFIITAIISNNPSPIIISVAVLLGIVIVVGILFFYLWLFSRLSIFELPIILEKNSDVIRSIGRSVELTKGFAKRLQLVYGIAFLLTLPISALVQIFTSWLQVFFTNLIEASTANKGILYFLLYLIIVVSVTLVSSAFFLPFWQAVKAIVYYDLITRKEGLDLTMQNGLQEDL